MAQQPSTSDVSYTEVIETPAKRLCLYRQPGTGSEHEVINDVGLTSVHEEVLLNWLKRGELSNVMTLLLGLPVDQRGASLASAVLVLHRDITASKTSESSTSSVDGKGDLWSEDSWKLMIRNLLSWLIFGTSDVPHLSSEVASSNSLEVACHFVLLLAKRLQTYIGDSISTTMSSFIEVVITVYQILRKNDDLNEINVAMLECFEILGDTLQKLPIFNQVMMLLNTSLQSSCAHVRAKTLDLLGLWGRPDLVLAGSGGTVLAEVVQWHTEDGDSRVRCRAFAAFLAWHRRGLRVPLSLYEVTCVGMADEDEQVRETCIRLLCMLIHLYADTWRPMEPGEMNGEDSGAGGRRLADDGFCQLCTAMQDSSVRVRALAASMLGTIHEVSEPFLLQTLDKKVMSDLRLKKSVHARAVEGKAEWSTGRQWAADAPQGDTPAAEEVSLVAMGACGAVVHGLEDEFCEVRNATIDSVCQLATRCTRFAVACQDFLVDMLTDDLESVRLNAVNSLRQLAHRVLLRPEQLNIVMGALQEGSGHMRRALHNLLAQSRLAGADCLMPMVEGLLKNLNRYMQDKESIWRCASLVGERHPELVHLCITRLLNLHPYLSAPVPKLEDSAYITVLLLVFSAAAHAPGIQSSFPRHVASAHVYLKELLPDLTPELDQHLKTSLAGSSNLRRLSSTVVGEEMSGPSATLSSDSVFQFFRQTLQRFQEAVRSLHTSSPVKEDTASQTIDRQVDLLRHLVNDLDQLARLDESLSPAAHCLRDLCRAVILVSSRPITEVLLDEAIMQVLKVEHLYSGLSTEDLRKVRYFRQSLLRQLVQLREGVDLSESGSSLGRWSCLGPLATLDLTSLEGGGEMHRLSVHMICPVEGSQTDSNMRFTAGLSVALRVRATVCGVETPSGQGPSGVEVCVRCPDGRVLRWVPPDGAWTRVDRWEHELRTDVELSAGQWSEAGYVELALALDMGGPKLALTKPAKMKLLPQAPMKR